MLTFCRCVCRLFRSLLLICCFYPVCLTAQTDTLPDKADSLFAVKSSGLKSMQQKYGNMEVQLRKQDLKLLAAMQKKETALYEKMAIKDPARARVLLQGSKERYSRLMTSLSDNKGKEQLREYMPGMDTISNAVRFLLSPESVGRIPAGIKGKLQGTDSCLSHLQSQVAQSEKVKNFIKDHQQKLSAQLSDVAYAKQLTGIRKEVYYYEERLHNIKSEINHPQALEQRLYSTLKENAAFKSFINKNSYFKQLYPASAKDTAAKEPAGSILSKAQFQQLFTERMGTKKDSAAADTYFKQQIATVAKSSSAGGTAGTMTKAVPPVPFTPNTQKNKSFAQRTELSANIQSQGGTTLLPAITDLGLSAGYKLNDKLTAGAGISYKMGWGKLFNDIHLTGEGVSFRSFADSKLKGTFWFTAAWEWNYLQRFSGLKELNNLDAWQRSALIGITNKVRVGRKTGTVQLLWDLLNTSHVPQTQALKFRVGYSL